MPVRGREHLNAREAARLIERVAVGRTPLVVFTACYGRLAMYRRQVAIPLGLGSMAIQSPFLAWT